MAEELWKIGAVDSVGRFAPSPTSDLHIGNLRTALAAWLLSRSSGGRFLLRIEDLDQARVLAAPDVANRQLQDLARIGLDWDGEVVIQSERKGLYAEALRHLGERVYPCFCTRREIAEASSAPHDGHRPYPGTCRDLSSVQRSQRELNRRPALRIRADSVVKEVVDLKAGHVSGIVDDFVLMRNDGTFAYNLATVVDDGEQGVTQVCRGDDLLLSAPRQAWLADQLGYQIPTYAHVSLVTNDSGQRLAKRDGAVTLADLADSGVAPKQVCAELAESLGLGRFETPAQALAHLEPGFRGNEKWWQPISWP